MPYLTDVRGKKIFTINDGDTVGRSSKCTHKLCLQEISRKHATFRFDKGRWFICDEESTNGTRINGTPITPRKNFRLENGDFVAFSVFQLRFVAE